jgi:hypothetical protein
MRLFKFMLLDRKTTGERFCIVSLAALAGIGFMLLMLLFEGKINPEGKFNIDLIKTFHIFVLSVPAAGVLWIFRNEDKKIDHDNAEDLETRHYNAIKADNLFRIIQIIVTDLSAILGEEIKVKSKLLMGNVDSAKIRWIIGQKNLYKISKISEDIEIIDLMKYNSILNILNERYLTLIKHLERFGEVTDDDTLSKHYATQNYFFAFYDNCDPKVKSFLKQYGKEAAEGRYSLPFYKGLKD